MMHPCLNSRRRAGLATRLAASLALLAGGWSGGHCHAAAAAGLASTELVYVGTQGDQISALRLDTAAGTLTPIGPVANGLRPTWLLAHPRLPVLYAVDDENGQEGSVTAFAVQRTSGALTRLGQVASGGRGTTYLALDATATTLLAANFSSASVSSIAVNADGSLGALVSTITERGSGPHRRQASAHAHGVVVDPSGRYALVSDLGADRVFVYGFDAATHALAPAAATPQRSYAAPAGSGPRHAAFGLDGRHLYVLDELTAEIMTLAWDAGPGRLAPQQSLPTSSAGFAGVKSGAELAVSADGRFVYVADRGENTLVTYRVEGTTGQLALSSRVGSGGDGPWGFAIDPSGRWMLVAHQRGGTVNLFRVDPATGALADTGQALAIPTAVSVVFVR